MTGDIKKKRLETCIGVLKSMIFIFCVFHLFTFAFSFAFTFAFMFMFMYGMMNIIPSNKMIDIEHQLLVYACVCIYTHMCVYICIQFLTNDCFCWHLNRMHAYSYVRTCMHTYLGHCVHTVKINSLFLDHKLSSCIKKFHLNFALKLNEKHFHPGARSNETMIH